MGTWSGEVPLPPGADSPFHTQGGPGGSSMKIRKDKKMKAHNFSRLPQRQAAGGFPPPPTPYLQGSSAGGRAGPSSGSFSIPIPIQRSSSSFCPDLTLLFQQTWEAGARSLAYRECPIDISDGIIGPILQTKKLGLARVGRLS